MGTYATGKDRVNLALKAENISWLRDVAGQGRVMGEYVDRLIEDARFNRTSADRLERVLSRLERISAAAARQG